MSVLVEAACLSDTGRTRGNNEDNFVFFDSFMPVDNNGTPEVLYRTENTKERQYLAVFDGMGGENYGEYASFSAAESLCKNMIRDETLSGKQLYSLCNIMNEAVLKKAEEMKTEHMGSTFALITFSREELLIMNVGDTRIYRLRNRLLLQLSRDHLATVDAQQHFKPPLSQNLGIRREELFLDPRIARGDLQPNDRYLICSDGLTDMLTEREIYDFLVEEEDIRKCVEKLMNAAMDRGGRDNTTVILARIMEEVKGEQNGCNE